MAEIVCDTGVIIGYGWIQDVSHPHCCRFFRKYPAECHSFYYPKKVKEELTYMRKRIARELSGFEYELRLMYLVIREFLKSATKLDYEDSMYNWDLLYDVVEGVMMIYQKKQRKEISFDANHMAHYICFCVEKGGNSTHFFITADKKLYKIRQKLQRAACNALNEEFQVNVESVWRF